MKQLNFKGNSITEWQEHKRFYRENFWQHLESRNMELNKIAIQELIYEDFNIQVGAEKYKRSNNRKSYRNGYRKRSFEIVNGYITDLTIPRARKLDIRFSIFDKWQRIQDKVLIAMTNAYLLGKSSACAQVIAESFGQSKYSRSFFQRLTKRFETKLEQFKYQSIDNWEYVFIDGMFVKVFDTKLKKKVVIFAYGMNDKRQSQLLSWVIADQEDEVSVRGLLIDLKRKGLTKPQLFISDESKGIASALKLEYPHTERQICTFHKVKNIQFHLKNRENRKSIMREAADIYEVSKNKSQAVSRLNLFKKNWADIEPKAVKLFCANFEYTVRYFKFPEYMWKSIRTSNPIEQFIGKMRAWTSKFNYFHGKANLELAMFTYLSFKKDELVPDKILPHFKNYTLFVA